MYVVKLSFTIISEYDPNIELSILNLIRHLRYHGRIVGRPTYLIKTGNIWSVDCLMPEANSLSVHDKFLSINSIKDLKGSIELKILGEDIFTTEVCDCVRHNFFIFKGSANSPLYCGGCNKHVPLYRIPPTHEKDASYFDIISWNIENMAWDDIEFYSKLEPIAQEQLGNIESNHNQEALAICQKILKKSGIPCYFYLESFENGHEKLCPICHQDWFLDKKYLDQYEYKCDDCKLLG